MSTFFLVAHYSLFLQENSRLYCSRECGHASGLLSSPNLLPSMLPFLLLIMIYFLSLTNHIAVIYDKVKGQARVACLLLQLINHQSHLLNSNYMPRVFKYSNYHHQTRSDYSVPGMMVGISQTSVKPHKNSERALVSFYRCCWYKDQAAYY